MRDKSNTTKKNDRKQGETEDRMESEEEEEEEESR